MLSLFWIILKYFLIRLKRNLLTIFSLDSLEKMIFVLDYFAYYFSAFARRWHVDITFEEAGLIIGFFVGWAFIVLIFIFK